LILLDFSINNRLFKSQVYRRVAEIAEEDFFSDPIGRRRLDQKFLPFGIKIRPFSWLWNLSRVFSKKSSRLFVWRYLSAKQKISSLRPRRLSGENLILDKHETAAASCKKTGRVLSWLVLRRIARKRHCISGLPMGLQSFPSRITNLRPSVAFSIIDVRDLGGKILFKAYLENSNDRGEKSEKMALDYHCWMCPFFFFIRPRFSTGSEGS